MGLRIETEAITSAVAYSSQYQAIIHQLFEVVPAPNDTSEDYTSFYHAQPLHIYSLIEEFTLENNYYQKEAVADEAKLTDSCSSPSSIKILYEKYQFLLKCYNDRENICRFNRYHTHAQRQAFLLFLEQVRYRLIVTLLLHLSVQNLSSVAQAEANNRDQITKILSYLNGTAEVINITAELVDGVIGALAILPPTSPLTAALGLILGAACAAINGTQRTVIDVLPLHKSHREKVLLPLDAVYQKQLAAASIMNDVLLKQAYRFNKSDYARYAQLAMLIHENLLQKADHFSPWVESTRRTILRYLSAFMTGVVSGATKYFLISSLTVLGGSCIMLGLVTNPPGWCLSLLLASSIIGGSMAGLFAFRQMCESFIKIFNPERKERIKTLKDLKWYRDTHLQFPQDIKNTYKDKIKFIPIIRQLFRPPLKRSACDFELHKPKRVKGYWSSVKRGSSDAEFYHRPKSKCFPKDFRDLKGFVPPSPSRKKN